MKNLRHAYLRNLENMNETQQTTRYMEARLQRKKKYPHIDFASARRTGNYKYFARTCRVLGKKILESGVRLGLLGKNIAFGTQLEPRQP
jgi:hypothetical protein